MTTGKRIRQLRLDRNLSQKKLAWKLGIHRHTIGGWENDRWLPPWASLGQLADFFHVSIQYLLNGDDKGGG